MRRNEAETAAERIARLESEIGARRAEIARLERGIPGRANARAGEEGRGDETNRLIGKSRSWRAPLRDLVNSWGRRFDGSGTVRMTAPPEEVAPDPLDAPPATVYTTSSDSDETSSLASDVLSESGSSIDAHLGDEREALRAIIRSDTNIIEGLMAAVERLAKNEGEARAVSLDHIAQLKNALMVRNESLRPRSSQDDDISDTTEPTEASEPTSASTGDPDEALEAKCARLEDAIAHLQAHSSDQENVIEFLKAEGVKLMAANRIIERRMSRRIATVEACSSSLEDAIETLRAENLRLRIRSRNLEGERAAIEEEMETIKNGVRTFYIERSRYEIL